MVNPNILDNTHIEGYLKEAFLLQGTLQALTEEKKVVFDRVAKAKKWLQKQPDYVKFLQHLQDILHQKNIGAFSELLSYFVHDVLQKDKDISMELYTYHNLPALRIEAVNGGHKESILEGSGGSIANIVSTGLRLIALSRMTNRKFIILDEPDCWLKPDHIPLFAKIIGEISNKLKIQTVIISHHHWKYFKDYGRVIELKRDGAHLTTEVIYDSPVDDNVDDDVIKKVILRRVMSHYETHFDLHPNLTVFIGENDLGKSVFATALKAVAYADSADSYIMHNESEAQVVIELNDTRQILWQRFRVTSQENPQKVKFSLYKDSQLVASAYSANSVPEFIGKELNISTVEDIDVHIGNQKQPVFLLSSDVKPQERAKILSLGKESLIIQKMMENIKTKTKQYKNSVKEGEERYNMIERQIHVLTGIHDLIVDLEDLKTEVFYLQQQQKQISELSQTVDVLQLAEQAASIPKIEEMNIVEPELKNLDELNYIISELKAHEVISKLAKVNFVADNFTLHDTKSLETIMTDLYKLECICEIVKIDMDVSDIELHNTKELTTAISMLSKLEQASKISGIVLDIVPPVLYNTEDLEKLIKQLEAESQFKKLSLIDTTLPEPVLNNTSELEALIQQIQFEQKQTEELLVKQKNVESWKLIIDKEVEDVIGSMGHMCPTCHQEINKEHILGNLHA